jgi:serine protease inhibitor
MKCKFILIIAVLMLMLTGCGENNCVNQSDQFPYQVVNIDGCQYIKIRNETYLFYIYTICHKGNCTNSIHKFNQ